MIHRIRKRKSVAPVEEVLVSVYGRLGLARKASGEELGEKEMLAEEIGKLGPFAVISKGEDLPVVAWKIKEDAGVKFSLFDFTDRLRMNGWLVPAYSMPKNREDLVIARAVVKHGFSRDLAGELVDDMRRYLEYFEGQEGLKPGRRKGNFHQG